MTTTHPIGHHKQSTAAVHLVFSLLTRAFRLESLRPQSINDGFAERSISKCTRVLIQQTSYLPKRTGLHPLHRCIALHVNQAYRVLSCSGATSFSDPGRRGLLLGAIVSYCSQTDLPRSFRILESCCTNLHRTSESTGSQTLLWRTLYVTEDLSCRILTETLVVQTPRTRPVGDCARSTAQSRSSSLTAAELWRMDRT